jgi:hypothetical protein
MYDIGKMWWLKRWDPSVMGPWAQSFSLLVRKCRGIWRGFLCGGFVNHIHYVIKYVWHISSKLIKLQLYIHVATVYQLHLCKPIKNKKPSHKNTHKTESETHAVFQDRPERVKSNLITMRNDSWILNKRLA